MMDDPRLAQWDELMSRMAAYLRTVVDTKSADDRAEVELLRDYWLLRATTDDERESVRRHFYQPCEHCPTYDDRLAVGRENDELHAQGKVRLVWPCCGAPLGFETVLERETREALTALTERAKP